MGHKKRGCVFHKEFQKLIILKSILNVLLVLFLTKLNSIIVFDNDNLAIKKKHMQVCFFFFTTVYLVSYRIPKTYSIKIYFKCFFHIISYKIQQYKRSFIVSIKVSKFVSIKKKISIQNL